MHCIVRCIVLLLSAIESCYYAVCMHDIGNQTMAKSAVKSWGIPGNFHCAPGDWSSVAEPG